MAWPSVAPAPVVGDHAAVFRDLCENQGQLRPCQPDLTGLSVLPHKRMAHSARWTLDRADQTHLSRVLSAASWREDAVHHRRLRFLRQQPASHRRRRRDAMVVIDDTRGEHVGRLFDEVDGHDHHRDGTSPVAHHPVTSFPGRGPVRFPWGLRLDRRDADLPPWEAAVATHVPALPIPTQTTARNRLPKQVDPPLLQDPECRARHAPCRTTMARAVALGEEAIRGTGPVGVVVFDAWELAEDVVRVVARRRQDCSRRLQKNRRLETASVHRRDAYGWPLTRPGPPIAVAEWVPLIPTTADRPSNVGAHPYGCVTLGGRIPGWGKGRIVVSFDTAQLTGRAVVLVANRVDWSAATIMGRYGQRWPTATFDQDRTGPLGVNADRMRSAEAMGNHGCLVFVASSLVHRTCLPAVPDRTNHLIHSLGDACRHQGRAWLQQLWVCVHDRWSSGVTVDHVVASLLAKKRGIVPA